MDWLPPAAFALDLVLGDPRRLPHPVVWIGALINHLEPLFGGLIKNGRRAGVLLTLITLLITGLASWGILLVGDMWHPALGVAIAIWMAYTSLSLHSLHRESRSVVRLVRQGRLEDARLSLALIVGRETASLDEEGILKACIETVSENTSDGIVAPLFYLFLGGPILALLYKAASTLDSMVGYTTERYREIGWASARLDDVLNYIPARLTAFLMIFSALPLGLNPWGALKATFRDGGKSQSPNAGYPQAAAAGALGVRLGGPATYFGTPVVKPWLGDDDRPVTVQSYRKMVGLMYLSSFLALGLGMAIVWLIR